MVLTLILVISFYILLWSVFPLRQAMIGELWKYFKGPMILSLLYFGLTVGERVIRLIEFNKNKNSVNNDIWDVF